MITDAVVVGKVPEDVKWVVDWMWQRSAAGGARLAVGACNVVQRRWGGTVAS